MANPPLRIRFSFSHQGATSTTTGVRQRTGRAIAAGVVENLGFGAAEEAVSNVRAEIAANFQLDAHRELVHIASLFRQHVTGISGQNFAPTGRFTYGLGPSNGPFGLDDGRIRPNQSVDWDERSSSYLKWKKGKFGQTKWFENTGYLKSKIRANMLSESFGPVRVSVTRNLRADQPTRLLGGTRSGRIKFNVATVRVFALSNITPAMLPALATGDPKTLNSHDGRKTGLLSLIARTGEEDVAVRLGGNPKTTPYRPTLEPFLAFYLTRSIPNAIALRIEQGLRKRR